MHTVAIWATCCGHCTKQELVVCSLPYTCRKTYGQVVDELLNTTQALRDKERQLQRLSSKRRGRGPSSTGTTNQSKQPEVADVSSATAADCVAATPCASAQPSQGKPAVRLLKVHSQLSTVQPSEVMAAISSQANWGSEAGAVEARVQDRRGLEAGSNPGAEAVSPLPPSADSTPPPSWPPQATPEATTSADPWLQLQQATEELSRLYYSPNSPEATAVQGQQQPQPGSARHTLFQEELQPGRVMAASSAFPFFHEQSPFLGHAAPQPRQPGEISEKAVGLFARAASSLLPTSAAPAMHQAGSLQVRPINEEQNMLQHPASTYAALATPTSPASSASGSCSGYFAPDSAAREGGVSSSSGSESAWDAAPSMMPGQRAPHRHAWTGVFLPAGSLGRGAVQSQWTAGTQSRPACAAPPPAATAAASAPAPVSGYSATSAPGDLPQVWDGGSSAGQSQHSRPRVSAGGGQAQTVIGMTDGIVGFMRGAVQPSTATQQDGQASSDALFQAIKGQLESLQAAFHAEVEQVHKDASAVQPPCPEQAAAQVAPTMQRNALSSQPHCAAWNMDGVASSDLVWPGAVAATATAGATLATQSVASKSATAAGWIPAPSMGAEHGHDVQNPIVPRGFVVVGMEGTQP